MVEALLTKFLGAKKVRLAAETSHVLGNHGSYEVFPDSEEEIAAVLRAAHEQKWTVIPMGKGTKRGFGGTKEKADILLHLSRFQGIVEYSPNDMTVTVKPGTTIQEMTARLSAHGQMLPLDPAWPEQATIGGVVAANDSGPKRLRYGSARDHVIGMRVVYPDGRIIRTGGKVVKNVAGYDMNKLFIGSMGTLAVISEITLKLRPLPPFQCLLILSFPDGDLDKIRSFAISLLDSLLEPVSLELLSPAVHQAMNDGKGYALAIAFEDEEKAVRYQAEWVMARLPKEADLQTWEQEGAVDWWRRFSRLAPSAAISAAQEESLLAVKIGSQNMDVLDIVRTCHELGEQFDIPVQVHGGVGHGITARICKETRHSLRLSSKRSVRSPKENEGMRCYSTPRWNGGESWMSGERNRRPFP